MRHILIIALSAIALLSSCKQWDENYLDNALCYYDDMISFIVQGYQCHWTFDTEPSIYGLSDIYCYESPTLGFIKTDINGDGLEEAIFGENFEEGPTVIYDILTIDTRTFQGTVLASGGERDRYYLTSDGTLVEEGSSSADSSFRKTYKIRRIDLKEIKKEVDSSSFIRLDLDYFIRYAMPESIEIE